GVGSQRGAAERRCVHREGRERLDVAPVAEMVADVAAFVETDGQFEAGGVQGGLDSDGASAEDGDARRGVARHDEGSPCRERLEACYHAGAHSDTPEEIQPRITWMTRIRTQPEAPARGWLPRARRAVTDPCYPWLNAFQSSVDDPGGS